MLRNLSIRTGLLALLGVMAFLLILISGMGVIAINKSYQSLQIINRIQGVELGNLASSNTNMQRVRVAASFAIRGLQVFFCRIGIMCRCGKSRPAAFF